MTDQSTSLRDAAHAGASTEVATRREAAPTLKDLLKRQESGIARALPSHVPAGSYMRAILTDLSRTPKLLACTPNSFFGAVMTAAQLGLTPGPALGEAYLVPYGTTVQLIVGYRGYLSLARRSGQLVSCVARERCTNDLWEFEYGIDEKLRHIPAEGDRGPVLGYYGVAIFKDGGHLIHYMTVADIEKRRKRSKAKDDGPWKTDYDAMARKTVIRAMAPWLPLATEDGGPGIAEAMQADGAVLNMHGDEIVPDFVETDENVIDGEVVDDGDATSQATAEAPRTSSPKAHHDQVNALLDALRAKGVPNQAHNATVGALIGRTIRGFTNLSVAEVEMALAGLAQQPTVDAEVVGEESTAIDPADLELNEEQFAHFIDDLTEGGVPPTAQAAYMIEVLGEGNIDPMTFGRARKVIEALRSENAAAQ